MELPSYDGIWDELYKIGHHNKYPWDSVVSFVFRYAPRGIDRSGIRILEIGCGTASNLQFVATEGFSAYGIDNSVLALSLAANRLESLGLTVQFAVSNYVALPFEDNFFDLVIDRAAITHTGVSHAGVAIQQVHRVLKPGGKFFCNPYSQDHTSYHYSAVVDDGLSVNIERGSLVNVGQLCFWNRELVDLFFSTSAWQMLSCRHLLNREHSQPDLQDSEWRIVVEKLLLDDRNSY